MPHSVTGFVAVLTAMFASVASGQGYQQLSIYKTKVIEGTSVTGIATPIKCDANGDIFTRLLAGGDVAGATLVRISHDGEKVVKFFVPSESTLEQARLMDFSPTRGGLSIVLAADSPIVIKYDSDGKLLDEVKIEPVLRPTQIAVFDSGDFILAGKSPAMVDKGAIGATVPFMGLFSSDGRLLKTIQLRTDLKRADKKAGMQKAFDVAFETAIAGSLLIIGDDGNAYLMRKTPSGPIYQISVAGVVTKIIHLKPSESTRNAGRFAVGHGQILVEFLKFKRGSDSELDSVMLKIIESATGATVAQLTHSNSEIGFSLACYNDQGHPVFLKYDDTSHLKIVETGY